MNILRKIATVGVGTVVLAAGMAMLAAPASASAGAPPSTSLRVDVSVSGGVFTACATGSTSSSLGTFSFVITGSRSDGSLIAPPPIIATGVTSFAPRPCTTVTKNGTTAGGFTATLTYLGAGLANTAVGTGTWNPVEGDRVTSSRGVIGGSSLSAGTLQAG